MRGEDAAAQRWVRGAKELHAGGFAAPGCADAFAEEVVGVRPRAGIAVDVGRAEAKRNVDQVAAVKGELRAVDREADAAGGGLHHGDVGREVFDGLDVEVDGLRVGVWVGIRLPCVGFERGVGEIVRREREGADADDGALDVAGKAVGEMVERGLLRDSGLDLRAPAADGDPESIGGNDCNARGFAQAEEGEREEQERGGGEQEGRLPTEGEEVAESETGVRSEQRNPAKPERLDDRGVVQPGCGSTDSRHEKRYLKTECRE